MAFLGFGKNTAAGAPGIEDPEKNMLRSIVASMEDALVVYDSTFVVRFANQAAERLFGVPLSELIGRTVSPKDVDDPHLTRITQTIFPTLAPTIIPRSRSGEFPQIVDITFASPEMELRTITSPIADSTGRATGFMKIIRDRTRETSLAKTKTEFITVASHQLRTPITNLEWSLETLANDPKLPPDLKTLVDGAAVSAHSLQEIVENLLNISKIEEGRFGYNLEKTDLTDFIEKLLANVLPQARRIGISMYFNKPAEALPEVMIDRTKLGMVLQNLIDNAIRYNVQQGSVTVTVEKAHEGPFLDVSVKDTGIGIPKEEAQKLFGKFYRATNAVQAVADGSGLGLYIARNIVQSHGGRIWVESELHRGSTFHFTVPTDPSLIPPKEVPFED
jgi:two-component system phosphate regulon sensor histidine kinase PhoR